MFVIRVSRATPTTSRDTSVPVQLVMTCFPMASWPGHMARANDSLTTVTGTDPALSVASTPRPCTMRMPIAPKNPGETIR